MVTIPWADAFGLQAPIVNAPMGGVAGGRLAAAVSGAGGLGMIGVGSAGSVEQLRLESAIARDAGARFGIGLLAWKLERDPELLEAAIAAGPVLISVSFGAVARWVGPVKAAGIAFACQAGNTAEALVAAEEGADIVVARGSEGGGHGRNAVSTLPLLEGVLDAVDLPVLAAGGISTGRGLAAVLAAGAAGAWIGTAFIACPESLASDEVRNKVIEAGETDTVYSRVFDVALGYPWPEEYGERVLANRFTRRWAGRETELAADGAALAELAGARADGDLELAEVDAGQGVGLVTGARPAAAVVADLTGRAEALLSRWSHLPDRGVDAQLGPLAPSLAAHGESGSAHPGGTQQMRRAQRSG